MNEQAFEARPSLFQRLMWRLSPRPPRPLLMNDPRTFLTVELHSRVGWRDRLLLLLSGRLRVMTLVYTDVEVKDAESHSVVWVE